MDKFNFKLNGKRKQIVFIACENPQQDLLCDGNRIIMSGVSIKRFQEWMKKQSFN